MLHLDKVFIVSKSDESKKAIDSGYSKVEEFFDYNAILTFQEQNEKVFNNYLN
jgi:hypothetical protein